jgi:predicted NAD/FAD-binding protein
MRFPIRQQIAVIGTGIAGMSAAWLLSRRHDVTVLEQADRVGGHSNTVMAPGLQGTIPVDTGFIVYNEATYPNLTALLAHLGVPSRPSDMSLAISLEGGGFEYAGNLRGLLAQPSNIVSPRFWSMLRDLHRFYRDAPGDLAAMDDDLSLTLGDYLRTRDYGDAFRDLHLLPMAAAIWSAPAAAMLDYPAAAFIRFQLNHGLLQLRGRPAWRTVVGGSAAYVERLTPSFADRMRLGCAIVAIRRDDRGVEVTDRAGEARRFDHVVLACHADQALAMLRDASPQERRLLGAFRYSRNLAALHSDPTLMPKRRAVWSSWNCMSHAGGQPPTVTYWMNRLQGLPAATSMFVTLNPPRPPRAGTLIHSEIYEHPLFDANALAAQRRLWSLQGVRSTWFCGAYFGAGFHEDGLQAGLAVAETLGGVRRPWSVPEESGRITIRPTSAPTEAGAA